MKDTATLEEMMETRLQSFFPNQDHLPPKKTLTEEPLIEHLLNQEDVTEVIISNWDTIFFENSEGLQKNSHSFSSKGHFNVFLNGLLKKLDTCVDQRSPSAEGHLDGTIRVHITIPPICHTPTICLRKHKKAPWPLDQLKLKSFLSAEQKNTLKKWVNDRLNILICGGTNTGKTTLARALLEEIPLDQRIVTIEDTPELGCNRPFSSQLFTRIDPLQVVPDIDLEALVKNALRMRPDRLVLGEIRGQEALVTLDAMATGHPGSITTVHGSSPHQALKRLEGLVLRAAPKWDTQVVRRLIADSIQGVIFLEKKEGMRKIASLNIVSSVEDFGILLERVT